MTYETYLGNDQGAVLGPYADTEISALQRGKALLGYPARPVYRIKSGSRLDAAGKLDGQLRRERQAQERR